MSPSDRREHIGNIAVDLPNQLIGKAYEMDKTSNDPKSHPQGNAVKDPDNWVTGDEPMTGAQASYLQTLSEEAGEEFDPALSKADASKAIDALQDETGRGA
jgi:Protein of unknown function (DUF3072)